MTRGEKDLIEKIENVIPYGYKDYAYMRKTILEIINIIENHKSQYDSINKAIEALPKG